MADILKPEINVGLELRMRFSGPGKRVTGNYGEQVMFTVHDKAGHEWVIYLNPIVATKIETLDLQPGEPFLLCKREKCDGQRKAIEWEVRRLTERTGPPAPAPVAATPQPAIVSRPAQPAAVSTPATAIVHGLMEQCLIEAMAAAAAAQKYGHDHGFPLLQFGESHIQALASTLYIQHSRNGGAR